MNSSTISRIPHRVVSSLCSICRREWRRNKVTVTRSTAKEIEIGTAGPTKIRNVGIMAHIDAGKTTTTERFLYYSGVIVNPGEVHHGDTVTDFLPQERERGITIQSAVVSFPWRNHAVNIIDTPGHVDFTFEVQRSLRVVDSAVAILDASAGVEAQTLTVWRQAAEYKLPRLIYLNKMDKNTASVDMCLESISSKLKCTSLLLQLPFYESNSGKGTGSGFRGVIDLVEMKRLIFDQQSKGVNVIPVDATDDAMVRKARNQLVEQLSDFDSELAEVVIETESVEGVTASQLYGALRRVTVKNLIVPILLGSSYKNVGVQPLMDSILRYFPSPLERVIADPVVSAYGSDLCSFAFKTMHDNQLGPLTFLRIFSGGIHHGQKIFNVSRGKHEKIAKIYLPLAEELRETEQVSGGGQVVIVSGLKETVTGDTLSSSHTVSSSVIKVLEKQGHKNEDRDGKIKATLSGVTVPEPVFFCSIEPISVSHQKTLDFALECLQREDPSLHVHVDPDTSQTVLSGMGELHLDIIHERLKTEFKVEADLGKIQVAYKETIATPVSKRIVFERRLADQKHSVCIELELTPTSNTSRPKLKLYKGKDKEKGENLTHIFERHIKHIQNGIESAMRFGPKLSFPILDIEVTLHWFEVGRGTSDAIIEAATAHCFREALKDTHIYLLEPFVRLDITVDENYQKVVLDDLNRRRFLFEFMEHKHGNKMITGTAPLSELLGYSTILRSISSGLGTFSQHFSHYQVVSNSLDEEKIISSVRGF